MQFLTCWSWWKEGILKLLFCLLFFSSNSQDLKFASRVVDTLCSSAFHGRGYVSRGDLIASEYIGNLFDSLGLIPFNQNNYFQKFDLSVNQFFGRMQLATEKNKFLIPGEDFIVDPLSPGATFKRAIFRLTKDNFLENPYFSNDHLPSFFDSLIIYSDNQGIYSEDSLKAFKLIEDFLSERVPMVKVASGKLTWSVGRKSMKHPKILIKPGVLNADVDSLEVIIDQQFINDYQSQNIIGYIEGEDTSKYVVLTGHYDHLGEMGQGIIFPGANDNASGIAMMLDMAKYYSQTKPKYTLIFIAFGAEEAGLVGSKYFVENPLFSLSRIKFLINLDLLGSGEDGITVVNGSVHKREFNKLLKINKKGNFLPSIKERGKAANSDHFWFGEKGVPSFFIYARGKSNAYHDIYDTPETLTYKGYEGVFRLLKEFIKKI